MKREYVIPMNILPLVRTRAVQNMFYDDMAHARIVFINSIEAQHGPERKFHGSLNLKLFLKLPFPDGIGKRKQVERDGRYHTNRPTISLFIKTLEEMLAGVLFTDGSTIVSVEAEKRMSASPGIQFTLTEVE